MSKLAELTEAARAAREARDELRRKIDELLRKEDARLRKKLGYNKVLNAWIDADNARYAEKCRIEKEAVVVLPADVMNGLKCLNAGTDWSGKLSVRWWNAKHVCVRKSSGRCWLNMMQPNVYTSAQYWLLDRKVLAKATYPCSGSTVRMDSCVAEITGRLSKETEKKWKEGAV